MVAAGLSPKQKRFVQEYLIDLNATQAAIRAGYSPKAATQVASRLLTYAKVQEAVASATKTRALGAQITRERVLQELARVAFGDPRKVMTWGPNGVDLINSETLTDDEAAQVAEVSQTVTQHGGSIKLKRFDKVKALELLGRHLGMFEEREDEGDEVVIEWGDVVGRRQ